MESPTGERSIWNFASSTIRRVERAKVTRRTASLLLGAAALLLVAADAPREVGGFVLADPTVDPSKILAGGPGRDGIPVVDAPVFSPAGEATWIGRDTEVLGVEIGGAAHAFPVRTLEYHQAVNDEIGGVPVVVTFDPLAGAPRAYRREVEGRTLRFGVSGLLYNHNFLLYDRETESLWSQFTGEAIAGKLAGKRLAPVVVRQETAAVWTRRAPGSVFLRYPAPERIAYQVSPYQTYWVQDKILFPVAAEDARYHPKELVAGVVVGDVARAYLGSIVTREGGSLEDEVAGVAIRLTYDSDTGTFGWEVPDGVRVEEAYWLAWKAFHPDTQIWRDELPPAG
jgi:hypothetical protein